jgi:transposase
VTRQTPGHEEPGACGEGVEGIARFHQMVGNHAEEPEQVVIGIETDRGLFVGALMAAGYQVFAVNPMSTSRYRDRHSTSGAKSDPGDAKVLADIVRTDRHNHRPVAGDSELAEPIKVLARAQRLPGGSGLLRLPQDRRRHSPRRAATRRKSACRYPSRLPRQPRDLQREHRLGTPGSPSTRTRRLTSCDSGMSREGSIE